MARGKSKAVTQTRISPRRTNGASQALTNTRDLREFLVLQMVAVANDDIDADTANSIVRLSQQIYNSLNIEVRVALARKKLGDNAGVEAIDFG